MNTKNYELTKINKAKKMVNDIINILYKKNTTYDKKTNITHRDFSNKDIYILERALEIKTIL